MRVVYSSLLQVCRLPLSLTIPSRVLRDIPLTFKGILNYKWAQNGPLDIYDKSIAALLTTLVFGAGVSYFKSGDKPTAFTLAVVGILQGLGARSAAF